MLTLKAFEAVEVRALSGVDAHSQAGKQHQQCVIVIGGGVSSSQNNPFLAMGTCKYCTPLFAAGTCWAGACI